MLVPATPDHAEKQGSLPKAKRVGTSGEAYRERAAIAPACASRGWRRCVSTCNSESCRRSSGTRGGVLARSNRSVLRAGRTRGERSRRRSLDARRTEQLPSSIRRCTSVSVAGSTAFENLMGASRIERLMTSVAQPVFAYWLFPSATARGKSRAPRKGLSGPMSSRTRPCA